MNTCGGGGLKGSLYVLELGKSKVKYLMNVEVNYVIQIALALKFVQETGAKCSRANLLF